MAFLVKEQLTPWYYWWTNTHNIRLRMNTNLATIENRKKLFDELTMNRFDSRENIATEGSEACVPNKEGMNNKVLIRK